MNRNGAAPPGNTNGGLPENLYIALAMGDRARIAPHPNAGGGGGGMMAAASNDPALLLAHYQSLPKDEVDWAAVAQQWIKMRESWIQPVPSRIPSPPPPPSFDRDDLVGTNGGTSTNNSRAQLPLEYAEEQGEAPMEVEWDEDDDLPAPPMPPIIAGSDWPQAAQTQPDHTAVPETAPPPSWNPSSVAYQPAAISQLSPTVQPHPTHPQISGSASAALEQWRAKNSHLFQSGGASGQPSAPTAPPIAANQTQHRSQGGHQRTTAAPLRLPGLMDREMKVGASRASASVSSPAPQHEHTPKDHGTMNEAKRQLLPAWIREALERMERDKQRQLERELELRQRAKEMESRQTYYDLSPVREEPEGKPAAAASSPSPTPPTPAPALAEAAAVAPEAKAIDVQKKTKQILTEILLEATDELLNAVAKATVARVQKRKGLAIYGDSDEEDEDNEDEQSADGSSTVKKPAAGADGAGSDDGGSGQHSSDDDLSDTEAMQALKERIKVKQRDFKAIASSIEQWLEEANDDTDPTASAVATKQPPPTASQTTRDSGNAERSDDEPESDNEAQTAQDGPDSSDAAPSHEFSVGGSRKRRDKRVSRFSDPRDTVRQTYITHVSIVSAASGGGSAAASKPPASSSSTVTPAAPVSTAPATVATPKPTKSGAAPQQQQPQQPQQQQQQAPVQPATQPYYSHYITRPGKPSMMIYSIAGDRKGEGKGAPPGSPELAARDLELSRRLTATGSDGADGGDREGSKRKRSNQRHRYRSPGSSSDSRSSSAHGSPRSHRGTRSRSRSRSRSSRRHRRDSADGGKHAAYHHRDYDRRHGYERSRSRDSSRSRHRHRRERSHRSRRSRSRSRSRSRGSSSSKYSSSHRRF